mgnify:CR=1 FL=1
MHKQSANTDNCFKSHSTCIYKPENHPNQYTYTFYISVRVPLSNHVNVFLLTANGMKLKCIL